MNNFSFLDTAPPVQAMPRAAPSPTTSQPQSNGMGGGGPVGGAATQGGGQQNGIPMVNGLPSGGQQTDMNHLWGVVQQLSQMLEENRAQTAGIVNGVQAIQQRAAEEGAGMGIREVNGELNAASQAAELQNLSHSLTAAQTTITTLTQSNTTLSTLLTDYENALTLLLDKLRPYAYNQTQAIVSLHKHYNSLLDQERATSMQLRLEHAEWQAGLGRVADYARGALTTSGEVERGLKGEIKELKEENRVLRRLAGWEEKPGGDSSDEEEGARE